MSTTGDVIRFLKSVYFVSDLSDDEEANAPEIAWRKHQVAALEDIIQKFDQPDG